MINSLVLFLISHKTRPFIMVECQKGFRGVTSLWEIPNKGHMQSQCMLSTLPLIGLGLSSLGGVVNVGVIPKWNKIPLHKDNYTINKLNTQYRYIRTVI